MGLEQIFRGLEDLGKVSSLNVNRRDILKFLGGTAALAVLSEISYSQQVPSVESYVKANSERFLRDFLIPWLKYQSISSDPSKSGDCRKAAEFFANGLRVSGLDARTIKLEKGNPLVYAEKMANPKLPTVLVYGHYDVQPVSNDWEVNGRRLEPFDPVIIGKNLYGRGASDDKGQLGFLVLVSDYFAKAGFPCNLKIIGDGDEESGNSSINDFIASRTEQLKTNAAMIIDTENLGDGYGAISQRTKGILMAELKYNDAYTLADIIHRLHDPIKNKVLIKGFYDRVMTQNIGPEILAKFGKPSKGMGRFLRPEEGYEILEHMWDRPTISPVYFSFANPDPSPDSSKQSYKIIIRGPEEALHSGAFGGPVQEPALYIAHLLSGLKESGIKCEIDYVDYGSSILSTSIRPLGEFQITAPKNVALKEEIEKVVKKYNLFGELIRVEEISDRRIYLDKNPEERFGKEIGTARAYLTFRLVSNQNPDDIYSSLEKVIGEERKIVSPMHKTLPFMTDLGNPYVNAVVEGVKKGYGKSNVHIVGVGGSIPIASILAHYLNAPVIMPGFSPSDSGKHGRNEFIPLEDIYAGARSMIYAMQNMGRLRQ
ncbi:MAG TPA: M20/M25/M40 family metallo-hydrolase [Candidatus Nanoarchaeia archaeon]|nr:M20/M25/M40 family metallo-hydrolase [Candidatus Nanoarchaeia archaeon]